MLENLFVENIFYYYGFTPILSTISFIVLVGCIAITLIIWQHKRNKNIFIIMGLPLILFAFLSYQIIPWYFTYDAIASEYDEAKYKRAITFSTCKAHKGVLYANLASRIGFQSHNGKKAIEYYEKSFECFPNNYNYEHLTAAMFYTMDGNYDKAIEVYDKIPKYKELYTVGYILKEDYEKALFSINKNISINPDDPNKYIKRAIVYKNLGKNDLAQKDYEKAIEMQKYKKIKQEYKKMYTNFKTYYRDYYSEQAKLYGLGE